ncbi:MAG: glycerol-3-phosphate dehydrogenase [Caldilineaceae bacterium]|nr:glycerol-3-phosphate dehydrogenase [Caldilineaceae bacterium]
MANVVILGAGVMGTAFSFPLADNGHQIRLVGTHLDGDIIEEIHESGRHPRLGSTVAASVTPYTYDRLGEVIVGADMVVLGVNSLGVDWAARMLGDVLSSVPAQIPVVLLTKGLVGDERGLHILPYALRAGLPAAQRSRISLAAIGGPSIAGELAERRDTCVVVTGEDEALLPHLANLLRTPYYHVWPNADFAGVEVCVAMKNIYALAVGLVGGFLERDGQGGNGAVMHNLAAGIFAQGLWEMAYLVEKMGGKRRSVFTLPGAGDLYVTSMGGRNSRMGRLLGLGMTYSQAKRERMPDDTIEGAQLAQAIGPAVERMVDAGELEGDALPLMRTMIDIVCHDAPAEIPWDAFFVQ